MFGTFPKSPHKTAGSHFLWKVEMVGRQEVCLHECDSQHSLPTKRVVYGGYRFHVGKYTSPIENFGNRKMIQKLKKKDQFFRAQNMFYLLVSTHLKKMQNSLKNCREQETSLSCWFSGPIFQGDVAVSLREGISNSQLKYWLEWRKRRGQQKNEEKSSI